ncbi:hypothetical protein C8R47DRAFT_1228187 [Mycena vitilis]|nr:hypothetical protein C8R47DRAFT_1228187 [Mycena vitilis]
MRAAHACTAGVGIGASRVPSSSALGKRTASGSAAAPDVITNLHKRLATLESARTQDTERLATLLESHTTASSSAASSSSTAGAADADAQAAAAAETHAELLAAQAQLAALTAQISVLSSELSTAKSALRAREESEASLRAETHTLRAETHTLNATILSGRTALARAEDDASALRRALARLEEEGEIRARRAERLLREAKDECEAAEARAGKLRTELGEAVGAETGGRERARVLHGRVEHLGAEVRSLQQENAAANALLREREEERARVEEEREGERRGWAEERAQMREEAGRGEEERRRLHGLVMELKGNIRRALASRPRKRRRRKPFLSIQMTPTNLPKVKKSRRHESPRGEGRINGALAALVTCLTTSQTMTSFKKIFINIAVAVKKAAAKFKTPDATVAQRTVAPFVGPPPSYVPPPSYEEATDPNEVLPPYSIHT